MFYELIFLDNVVVELTQFDFEVVDFLDGLFIGYLFAFGFLGGLLALTLSVKDHLGEALFNVLEQLLVRFRKVSHGVHLRQSSRRLGHLRGG